MVLSISRNRYEGVGIRRDRGINPKEAEHGCTINCDATYSGRLQAISAEAGSLGFSESTRRGRDLPIRGKVAGVSGGGHRGREERRRGGAGKDDG